MASADLADYYRRRAPEYEAIYAKPERQGDLRRLRRVVPALLAGCRVLELACGTGYWTGPIAGEARSVVATDIAGEVLALARNKRYPQGAVRFAVADAYQLEQNLGSFDAAFAGFWWSHVPRSRIEEFLRSLHGRLEPGALVVMLDNRYVEGSSTPVCERDSEGNSYQMRALDDGSRVRVLKNFPDEAELREHLAPYADALRYEALEYYWLLTYRLR